MNDRERLLNTMAYKPVDRAVYGVMTGGWPETYKRWAKEGWEAAKEPYFKTDRWDWIGHWFFPNPPFERTVLSEDEHTVTYINHEGITMRERKDESFSSMPQFISFPAQTPDDFRKFMKERMQPDIAARIGADYAQTLAAYKDRDFPLIIISDRWGGMFGGPRAMMGVENLCMMFYDDPDFVEEVMEKLADFIIAMMGQVLQYTDVDVYGFWEDMAYKTGPLMNPAMLRKMGLRHYRRVVDFVKSHGVKYVSLDSDGDVTGLLPVWMDAGIDIIYPFEVQCGMDVLKFRKEYGKDLRMWGGFDKRAVAWGPEAIEKEIARVRPLMEEGGYVCAPDHSLPPDTPFENYLYYMERMQQVVSESHC